MISGGTNSPAQQEEGWPKAGVVWSRSNRFKPAEMSNLMEPRRKDANYYLKELGIRVMRFENRAVFESLELVLKFNPTGIA